MGTRQELDKWLDYKLDSLIKQFGYADIVDASPAEIMSQLYIDRLELKKLTENLERRGEITIIDHHSKSNQKMILINRTEHHGEPMRDTGLRMCLVPTGDGKTFEQVRHLSHSDNIKCQFISPELWATKTTRQYNKNPNKAQTQTTVPEDNEINSTKLSEAPTAIYRGVAKVPERMKNVTVTYPNGKQDDFKLAGNGYLYAEEGKLVCKNDAVEIEAYWLKIRKPLTRFERSDRNLTKKVSIPVGDDLEVFWLNHINRGLYDEYGVQYGTYATWYVRMWLTFTAVMAYIFNKAITHTKQVRQERKHEQQLRKSYLKSQARKEKQKRIEEERNLRIYGSHKPPYPWLG